LFCYNRSSYYLAAENAEPSALKRALDDVNLAISLDPVHAQAYALRSQFLKSPLIAESESYFGDLCDKKVAELWNLEISAEKPNSLTSALSFTILHQIADDALLGIFFIF
jgi:hypothetical protein